MSLALPSSRRLSEASALGLAIVSFCGFSGLAAAATITETDALSIDTTAAPGASSSESLSFAQFNTALGTLTGVAIQLEGNADSVLTFINNSPSTIAFTNGSSSTSLQLSAAGLATQTSPALSANTASGTMNAGGSYPTFAYTYFPGSSSAVNLSGAVASGSLLGYEGVGTTSVSAAFNTASSSATFTAPGGEYFAGVGGGGQASGDVIVTYTYTPVPLPAALPLMLSGLAGLGAMTRRRKMALA